MSRLQIYIFTNLHLKDGFRVHQETYIDVEMLRTHLVFQWLYDPSMLKGTHQPSRNEDEVLGLEVSYLSAIGVIIYFNSFKVQKYVLILY